MSNKTLTEKRFKEILKEREERFKKQKYESLQKGLSSISKFLVGAGYLFLFLGLITAIMTGYIGGLIVFLQNEMFHTINLFSSMFNFFLFCLAYIFIVEIVVILAKALHKKQGLKNGE